MDKLAATLEPGGRNGKQPAAPFNPAQQVGAGGVKFSYATGARPLDGFTIKRGVGVGGFGEVYYAVSDAGKEVAIKRIQRNLDVELRGVSHCLNLKHTNLIQLFDIRYDDQGQAWVVMEYVSGENLKDVIDRNPHGMPVDQVLRWFREIAQGTEYLHDHGIVHRDLKPGNIFMDEEIVKIGDYGLAKFISCSRRSGNTESVGTFHYMAPEIGKGVYGKEIDIYALGIILYEMLTGKVPFDGESSQEIIMKHLTADPDLSKIGRPYRQVIQRALFKDPAKRYSRVAEIIHDLELGNGQLDPSAVNSQLDGVCPEIAFIPPNGEMVFGPVRTVRQATTKAITQVARPSPAVHPVMDEPIAKAVKNGWHQLTSWWNGSQLTAPIKVVLLVLGALTIAFNSGSLFPLAFTLGAAYLVYFGVRSLVIALNSPALVSSQATPLVPPIVIPVNSEAAVHQREAAVHQAPSLAFVDKAIPKDSGKRAVRKKLNWQVRAREILRNKPFSERCCEATGAMLMSALVAGVLSLIGLAIGGKPLNASVYTWSFFAWMAITTTISSWAVIAVSKVWEGFDGDDVRRRFLMLIVGLGLGVAAFGVRDFLGVRLQDDIVMRSSNDWLANLYNNDGTPRIPAFMLYFGCVFGVLRWWKQSDPLRETRLSIWSVGICVILARITQEFVPFYQPWGLMAVGITAVAVQLSAPMVSTSERERIRQQVREA